MKIAGLAFAAGMVFASFHLGNAADAWVGSQLGGKTRNLVSRSVQHEAATPFDDQVLQDDPSGVLPPTWKVLPQSANILGHGTQEGHRGRQLVIDSTCVSNSIVVIMGNKTSHDLLTCDTADGKHYFVPGIPDTVLQANKKDIIDGTVELNVMEGAYLNDETATLEMPTSLARLEVKDMFKKKDDNKQGLLFDRSRRSLAVTGTRSALVIRVVTSDNVPAGSEAYLSNQVFGNGADGTVDPVTMKSHFDTCSIGQLKIVEAADRNGKTLRIRKGKLNCNRYSAPKQVSLSNLVLTVLNTYTPYQEL